MTLGASDSVRFLPSCSRQGQRPPCPQMTALFHSSTRWELPCQEESAAGVVVPATSEEIPHWKPEGKFPLFPFWNGGCAVFLQGFPLFWILVGENSPWPALIPGSIQGQDVEVNHTYKHGSVHLDEHRSRWNKRSRACFLPQVVCPQPHEVWESRRARPIETFDIFCPLGGNEFKVGATLSGDDAVLAESNWKKAGSDIQCCVILI